MANDLFGAKTSSPMASPADGLKPIGLSTGKPMMPSSIGMSTPGMKPGGSMGSMADWTGAKPTMATAMGVQPTGGMVSDQLLQAFKPAPSTFPAQPTPQMPQTFPTAPQTPMSPRPTPAPMGMRGNSRPMPQMRMPQPSPMQGSFDRGPDVGALLAALFGGARG